MPTRQEFTHRLTRIADTPINGVEIASIKGALRGLWRGRRTTAPMALHVPGVRIADSRTCPTSSAPRISSSAARCTSSRGLGS